MKINAVNIAAFGKLKNYTLNFSDGLNLIFGENENGKTTVMEFIKMMFYGNIYTRAQSLDKNPRKKYKPWNGDTMAGSIDFEHGGTRYRLMREFKNSNSTDKITLINLDLGTSDTYTGNTCIGADILGLSGAAFEKSVFIDNNVALPDNTEADGEINARLTNLADTGDEEISLEAIIKRITAAKTDILSKTGKAGALAELRSRLVSLNTEFAECDRQNRERDRLEQSLAEKENAAEELARERAELFERLKSSEKSELKGKLQEFVAAAERYEDCEKALTLSDGTLADRQFCDTAEALLSRVSAYEVSVNEKSKEISRLTAEIAKMENAGGEQTSAHLDTLKRQKADTYEKIATLENRIFSLRGQLEAENAAINAVKPKNNIILLILGAVLAAVGILGAVLSQMPPLLTFAAAGVILFVLGFIIKIKPDTTGKSKELEQITSDKERLEQEISALKERAAALDNDINALLITKEANQSLLSSKRNEALSRQTELLSVQNALAEGKAQLFAHLGRFKPIGDVAAAGGLISEIETLINDMQQHKIAADYAVRGTKCTGIPDAREKLELLKNVTEAADTKADLQEQLKVLDERRNALIAEISALKAEARSHFKNLKALPELQREITDTESQIAEMTEYYEALDIADGALNSAFAELRRSYGGVIEKRTLEIFAALTGNAYNDISVSKNFDIMVTKTDTFGMHSHEYLSRGTSHQVYFALRLALSELLGADSGSLPFLLDDVFAQYDDKRLKLGFEFLKQYAKNNQVIFFTCHQNYIETAERLEAQIINM